MAKTKRRVRIHYRDSICLGFGLLQLDQLTGCDLHLQICCALGTGLQAGGMVEMPVPTKCQNLVPMQKGRWPFT